jgi:hypothetical protein
MKNKQAPEQSGACSCRNDVIGDIGTAVERAGVTS